jgi:pilus assembly protein CpaC
MRWAALWAVFTVAGWASSITLVVGRGMVVDCAGGVARVATSNPEAVDAVVASDSEVLFHGKAVGQATVVVWSKAGARQTYDVTVEPNWEPLRELLRATFPGEAIEVHAARDSLALVGRATTQAVADKALALASASSKGAVSALQVPAAAPDRQVLLRVRFAELNRSVSTEFGVNLLSTGAARTIGGVATGQFPSASLGEVGGAIPASSHGVASNFSLSDILNIFAFRPDLNLGLLIRDLQARGMLQILAEPNLVATDGKEASFLAGGEFPVPIVQAGAAAGAITVMFREFGIRLSFLPRLTANGTVKLHVRPEVSTIDPANGLTVSGFRIPALSTRRIETDIELAEGQSFVIAGLMDDRVIENLSRLPGLARIPLLGALFRSRSQTKAKTELVIVVTPEAASPMAAPPAGPSMPLPFLEPAGKGDK